VNVAHQAQFDLLKAAFLQNRLSHAYLLSGAIGLGKTDLAMTFAQWLLCDHKNHCGKCRSCLLMKASNHPDFILIQPEEKKQTIGIDQVRALSEKITHTAQQGGYQVVVISPADAMPVMAANALLKTLEEPTGKVVIFLIDNQRGLLPATIVSRCQKIVFLSHHVDLRLENNTLALRDELLTHLEKILDKRANTILFNPAWLKIKLTVFFQQLLLIASDVVRMQLGVDKKLIINQDVSDKIKKMALLVSSEKFQRCIDKMIEKQSMIAKGIHLNQQLCLEDVFIEWEKSCL